MDVNYLKRFQNLTYDDFKRLAQDSSLSCHEKVGFPDVYRKGKEELVWQDILNKMPNLQKQKQVICDIGPGCSLLPQMIIDHASKRNSSLIFCDSSEMLEALSPPPAVARIVGPFPQCWSDIEKHAGTVDVLICYSVLHYIFVDGNVWDFLDRCLQLLAVGGQFLLGDIPNEAKRRRFFSSPTGVAFHQNNFGKDSMPQVLWNEIEHTKLEDSVVFSILMRCRAAGFDAYVLPQPDDLPMASRREDILIVRP
jgi:hypothetical protein